jgi:hypothetical protein
MNRINWELSSKGVSYPSKKERRSPSQELSGRPILPGKYSLVLTSGGETVSQVVNVKIDPNLDINENDLRVRISRYDAAAAMMTELSTICNTLHSYRNAIRKVSSLTPAADGKAVKRNSDMVKQIEALFNSIFGPKHKGLIRENNFVYHYVSSPLNYTMSTLKDNQQAYQNRIQRARLELDILKIEFSRFTNDEWKKYKIYIDSLELKIFKD